jgi:hypothetical protein
MLAPCDSLELGTEFAVSSTYIVCRRIELAMAKALKGARIGCAWQMDTKDFLVTIEMRQRIRTFRLTETQSKQPDWQKALVEEVNNWFAKVPV